MTNDEMLTARDLGAGHPGLAFLTGRTPFFAYQSDQRFSYCVYVPTSFRFDGPIHSLLVVVHGTRRRAEAACDLFAGLADETGCVVLAPLFPAGIGDPNDLETYKFIKRGGVRYDHVLLGMVAEVGHRWGFDVERFHLWGYSGGGQFAHRFLFLHPNRLASASVGAPGRTTLLDSSRSWPDGVSDLEHRFGVEVDIAAIARVPLQVIVGADDSAIRTGEPGGERSRLDRAHDLAASLRAAGCTVELDIVPGVAHNSAATAPTATDFFERQIRPEDSSL